MPRRPAQPVRRRARDVCFSSPASLVSHHGQWEKSPVLAVMVSHWSSHAGCEKPSTGE